MYSKYFVSTEYELSSFKETFKLWIPTKIDNCAERLHLSSHLWNDEYNWQILILILLGISSIYHWMY